MDNFEIENDGFPTHFKLSILLEYFKGMSLGDDVILEKIWKKYKISSDQVHQWQATFTQEAFKIISANKNEENGSVEQSKLTSRLLKAAEIALKGDEGYTRSFDEGSLVDDGIKDKLDENILMDYDGLNYVRYMKQFCPSYHVNYPFDQDEAKYQFDINAVIHEKFHLRYYIPKSIITSRDDVRSNKVVVMINGMNEDYNFSFYDLLGEFFANNGLIAVLLPTPLHLNRRIDARKYWKEDGERYKPTDLASDNPLLFYYSFKRSHEELNELIEKINPQNKTCLENWWKKDKVDYAFYKKHFWKNETNLVNTEIVLFGYSLGGLKSLCYYLNHPKKFHCCITFNSGVDISQVNTTDLHIEPAKWKEICQKAHREINAIGDVLNWERYDPSLSKGNCSENEFRSIFKNVYFGGKNPVISHQFMKDQTYKYYLAITSGSDKIVDARKIAEIISEDTHINQLVVAGVDHNPTIDQNWHEILPRVENNILDFIQSCKKAHFKREEISKDLLVLIEEVPEFEEMYKNFNSNAIQHKPSVDNEEFNKFLNDIEKHYINKGKSNKDVKGILEEVLHLFYSSKGFFFNFSSLINKMHRDRQKGERLLKKNPQKNKDH